MAKPTFWNNTKRYYDLKSYWLNRFGCRVHKLPIDAGFTCPNRDGSVGDGGMHLLRRRGDRRSGRRESFPPSANRSAGERNFTGERGKAEKFIAYFQTFTNTYAPVDRLRALYDEALAEEDVIGLSIGTRPDCVPDETLALIRSYAERSHVWLEFGLQSIHDRTLRAINRGHDAAAFVDAVRRAARRADPDLRPYHRGAAGRIARRISWRRHGRSPDSRSRGSRSTASSPSRGRSSVNVTSSGEVALMTREEYVGTVCDILEILPPEMVIQRLTADGYREIFLGPAWAGNKLAVLNAIDRELEARDTWQGKKIRRNSMIGIVDYRAGNLTSVARALEYLHEPCIITSDAGVLDDASHIIFPGVGAAGHGDGESPRTAAWTAICGRWVQEGKPVLGICLGTQVIFEHSEEDDTPCLGIVPGSVRRFPGGSPGRRTEAEDPPHGLEPRRVPEGPPGLRRHPGGGRVLLRPLLLPGAVRRGLGGRVDRLRDPLLRRRGAGKPRRRPVPPGEERPAGPHASWPTSAAGEETMLSKRIIPCLDVRAGKLTKGIKFQGNIDIGDPVEAAREYYEQGADEIVFYDITASAEGRAIMIDVVRRVAETIFIPFSVGGGIRTVEDMRQVILAGAEKVSVNTEAVQNPAIIAEGARAFGSQCIVLGMDVKKSAANARDSLRL